MYRDDIATSESCSTGKDLRHLTNLIHAFRPPWGTRLGVQSSVSNFLTFVPSCIDRRLNLVVDEVLRYS
ncbi:hypothetical protein AGABI2DRAFT_138323 [Agaricus bisporus var. bisporus H97]|uniref:hypothetical protein n=1 Tax=Agaricus bisporus var. bisporus (strain H97 / ATCC MYA-4626 / FGSC 10389) TaxID=936046 RepID=UPI00029F7C65|nr:hypothetical protein AGABI2DRAFT_138323 [Agaricus bisporus var. bisporus H97]EKV43754.1 hypothetical protein AGABI2DRAFT_138323 [Agaricus bisporus var. bisporus H97]